MSTARFALGQVVSTPGALNAFCENGQEPLSFIARHARGDWGEVDQDDKDENDRSVQQRLRILSAYSLNDGTRIWIITEADRSATTVLLPEEY